MRRRVVCLSVIVCLFICQQKNSESCVRIWMKLSESVVHYIWKGLGQIVGFNFDFIDLKSWKKTILILNQIVRFLF